MWMALGFSKHNGLHYGVLSLWLHTCKHIQVILIRLNYVKYGMSLGLWCLFDMDRLGMPIRFNVLCQKLLFIYQRNFISLKIVFSTYLVKYSYPDLLTCTVCIRILQIGVQISMYFVTCVIFIYNNYKLQKSGVI